MGFDHPLARVLAKGCLEEMMALGSVPVTHYLVRDDDATGRQQIFNHSKAERKPKGQPDEVGNHIRPETDGGDKADHEWLVSCRMIAQRHPRPINITIPAV
jgi:hypothetical protein